MNTLKKIATFTFLSAIYILAIGLCYDESFKPIEQKYASEILNQKDDLRGFFSHTVPFDFSLNTRVPSFAQPYSAGDTLQNAVLWANPFFLDQLYSLNFFRVRVLIERAKADILYPFHFFF